MKLLQYPLGPWVMIALCLPAAAVAQPLDRSDPIGGSGGKPFEIICEPGMIMTGLAMHVSDRVDAVAPICAKALNSQQTDPRSRTIATPWAGGSGGIERNLNCPKNYPGIRSIAVQLLRDGRFIDGLSLTCQRASNALETRLGDSYNGVTLEEAILLHGPIDQGSYLPVTKCFPRFLAVGIHGRSGRWVDQIGLVCSLPVTHNPSISEHYEDRRGDRNNPYPTRPADANGVRQGQLQSPNASELIEERPGYYGDPAYPPAIDRPSSFGGPRSTSMPPSTLTPSTAPPRVQCQSGYVWREAGPGDFICVTPAARDRARLENDLAASRVDPTSPYGPSGCTSGFVWREAFPGDLACVSPQSRAAAAEENANNYQNRY